MLSYYCRSVLTSSNDRLLRNKLIQASCSTFPLDSCTGFLDTALRACRGLASGAAAHPLQESGIRGANEFDVTSFPQDKIRNFSIIAHIDHGKSTLADRLMEMAGAIQSGGKAQYLDKLQVERERGITVKAQTASLVFRHKGSSYLLNLIDTPGHVDFSYEVSRSLAAVSGAVLLVDAAQGIQGHGDVMLAVTVTNMTTEKAQTVANFYLAFEQSLAIVPVLNKCDMKTAEPEQVAEQMQQAFDVEASSCIKVSAKTGQGLENVVSGIIEKVPPPKGDAKGRLRMLLFDAVHDEYRGVICLLKVVDGEVVKGDRITAASNGEHHDILEVGLLVPEPFPTGKLCAGQVGYIITGMKTTKNAQIGDTWFRFKQPVEPLPGFKPSKSMVFAGVFPESASEFGPLSAAMERLTLNDGSVGVARENSAALGAGFRCGFLGLLHMEVFLQRLENEHGAKVISTPPTVPYKIDFADGEEVSIQSAAQFPSGRKIASVWEPTVDATVITPTEHVGGLMALCQDRRGDLVDHTVLSPTKTMMRFMLPLAELGGGFYDQLKSISSGYANFDYEEGEMRPADLVRLDLLINGNPVDALARIVHRSKSEKAGRMLCATMKELMDRQMLDVNIQAAVGSKVVARETIKAYRKNVLAKCYGGDVSRKRKLLDKQKEGKKRMARVGGGVEVPQEVFHSLIKTVS